MKKRRSVKKPVSGARKGRRFMSNGELDSKLNRRLKNTPEMRAKRIMTLCIAVLLFIAALVIGIKAVCSRNGAGEKTKIPKPKAQQTQKVKKADRGKIVGRASVLSMGDILIHTPLLKNAEDGEGGYAFENCFEKISATVSKADFAVINFELSMSGKEPYSGYPLFNTPDELALAVKRAGFDLALTANNHCYDTGFDGLVRTPGVLRRAGLKQTGTRVSADEKRYFTADINGIKTAFLNYTYETSSDTGRKAINGIQLCREAEPLINSFNEEHLGDFFRQLERDIRDIRRDGADIIILYPHWGTEYQLKQNEVQEKIARKAADLGVDAVIGGHPHVIQPAEVIHSDVSGKDVFVIYSMGNAVSNQRREYMAPHNSGHTEDGIAVVLNFVKYGDGSAKLSSVSYVPTWTNRCTRNGKLSYEITPLGLPGGFDGGDAAASIRRTEEIVKQGFDEFNALRKGAK